MATMKQDVFADDLSVMKALFQEFSRKEEFDLINSVEQDVQDIYQVCNAREADVKAIIKGEVANSALVCKCCMYSTWQSSHASLWKLKHISTWVLR